MSNTFLVNEFERIPFPAESTYINTDLSGQFSIVNNELVLERVDETALNDKLLTIDDSGLVSWKNEALIPVQPSPTFDNITVTNDVTLDGILQDDTGTQLLVLDPVTNKVEYRDVNTLPAGNPFNQDLNSFNNVEFQKTNINGNADIESIFPGELTITLDSATPNALFNHTGLASNGTTFLGIENFEEVATAHSGVLVKTTKNTETGLSGNMVTIYDNNGGDKWTIGHKQSDGTFRFNYSNEVYDLLTNDLNTKMLLENNGALTIANNMRISSTSDTQHRIVMLPEGSQTGGGSLLIAGFADQGYQMIVSNENRTATSHSILTLKSDGLSANLGGNNVIQMGNNAGVSDTWNFGKKKTDSTFRWNYGDADFLQDDANTKMKLSTAGALSLNEDLIITPSSDSLSVFLQQPLTTTGAKSFLFESASSDNSVQLEVLNSQDVATAHSEVLIRTQFSGGNPIIRHFRSGFAVWVHGYQTSSNTYRWNSDGGGNDKLDNDANTRMFLDSSGNLTLTGALKSSAGLNNDAPSFGSVNGDGTQSRVKRVGNYMASNSTIASVPVGTIGTPAVLPSGGFTNLFNLNGEWTNTGCECTYNGAEGAFIQIQGSTTVSGTGGDVVQLLILRNGVTYAAAGIAITGSQESHVSVNALYFVLPGELISLRLANLTAARNVTIRGAQFTIRSF